VPPDPQIPINSQSIRNWGLCPWTPLGTVPPEPKIPINSRARNYIG